MIFYFTGTGNSFWVAQELGKALDESLFSIADIMEEKKEEYLFSVKEKEIILFVFPVHSWGPPVLVTEFIKRLRVDGYQSQPVYSVCTCGDDCGYTDRMMHHALKKRGVQLSGSYSVTMPNNYILFPGFDVDTKEVEERKLSEAPGRIKEIIGVIQQGNEEKLYTTGTIPFIKSRLIQPLFIKFVLGKNSFYVKENCISCGLCKRICPTDTIGWKEDKPYWGNSCIQCLACFHRCPVRAIEYGTISLKKGRYHHSKYK